MNTIGERIAEKVNEWSIKTHKFHFGTSNLPEIAAIANEEVAKEIAPLVEALRQIGACGTYGGAGEAYSLVGDYRRIARAALALAGQEPARGTGKRKRKKIKQIL